MRLEPGLLPSIGVTRLPQYYEPLRHPTAPDPSLTGCRLIVRATTRRGFPCCLRFPCVHAAATTPARQRAALHCSSIPVMSAFPGMAAGSARASTFSRLARRSLALRPAHSRCHRIVARLTEGFNHFVSSIVAPVLPAGAVRRVGFAPTGKRRLCTAHANCGHRVLRSIAVVDQCLSERRLVAESGEPLRRRSMAELPIVHEVLQRWTDGRSSPAP